MDAPAGDERFRSLFDAHFDAVRAYCVRRLPVSDANDAVSEIFLTVWRRIDDVPPDGEARPWLFGVARNVVRNRDRSVRRSARLRVKLGGLAAAPNPGPEVQVVVAADQAAVRRALEALRPDEQEIVRLRLWEGMSVGETAAVMGLNVKAASKRYSRALGRVEQMLTQSGLRSPIGLDTTQGRAQ